MKTHWIYIFIGWCLFMFGMFYFAYWMDYNGWWVAFSSGEKFTTIFSIGGSIGFFILAYKSYKKQNESVIFDDLDALKSVSNDEDKDESKQVKPEDVCSIKLNQIRKGDNTTEIGSKGVINLYNDNFTIDVKKLNGKIIEYKYDDVISHTQKAGIMTMEPNWMWFYTSDERSYVLQFDKITDKTSFVDKCKKLSDKKQTTKVSSADELKKYKELLDSNVITEDEFEKKKKQLLGL